jgi:IclR family acetate operon transcriptional repressor
MMSEQREQGPVTRTISRAIAILESFDETRLHLGVTELSQLTGLDKSTVYRLLSALQQGSLIERDAETAKYHLGFGLVRLAGLALQHLDLPRIARPYLRELAELSGETVNLSVLTEDEKIINIDGITSPRRVRNVGWIGREMPMHAVSGGKTMLAFMPEQRQNRFLVQELERYTDHTITDPAVLRQQLKQIRQIGYGMAEEELEEGLSAVAAPILSAENQVQAAISVSGPSFRLPRERLKELGVAAKQIAVSISSQIGHITPDGELAPEEILTSD